MSKPVAESQGTLAAAAWFARAVLRRRGDVERQAGSSVDPRVARRIAAASACIAVLLVLAIPGVYFWSARERLQAELHSEAIVASHAVTDEIVRNPDHWRFGTVRLAGLLTTVRSRPDQEPSHRLLLALDGTVIVDAGPPPARPARYVRADIHDFGVPVATLVVSRSMVPILEVAGLLLLGSTFLGLLAFQLLRSVPLRMLDAAVRRAQHLASHDPLTGLANRDQLSQMLATALRDVDAVPVGVLVVDLDRFKPVNDMHGHKAGDELLQRLGERLKGLVRAAGDCVARTGGDEFVLVLRLDGPDPVATVARLGARVLAAIQQPVSLTGGITVQVGASVGAAIAPGDGRDPAQLMARADAAMYLAKGSGRGAFRFFEPGMDVALRERAALEGELREAIGSGQLVPHFQPVLRLVPEGRRELVGFEMLARWIHPERGMVPPDRFIPLAEASGLIGPMTEMLMRESFRIAASWPEHLLLSVNISPLQLRDRSLPELVGRLLAEAGLPPARLELELTESALVDDFELAEQVLNDLTRLGVRLALDDFGTGYSSLRHLHALPFNKIKIDASFVRSAEDNAEARTIVAAVVGLGRSLGLQTVAEGIEHEGLARTMIDLGCEIGQGWLFGKATSEAEAGAIAHAPPDRAADERPAA